MRRVCASLVLLWGAAAAAQEPAARINANSILQAPIAPIAPTVRVADPRAADDAGPGDGLPPRAARFRWQGDVRPVSAEELETARPREPVKPRPARGDEVHDYLRDSRRPKDVDHDETPRRAARDDDSRSSARDTDGDSGGGFGGRIRRLFDVNRDSLFVSDHEFETFISPVTNPFLFEDPRSLTEVRPVFVYQKVPDTQGDFQGGNLWFAGARGGVTITKNFSITLNKIGVTGVNPSSSSQLSGGTGLTELWFGPKVTLIRDVEFGTILAAGLQFQVPLGSDKAFQNTGKLSVVPYVSVGQNFLKTRLGSFNALANAGYAFSINKQRSDYLYASGHLSFDVLNSQKFFPLVEVNWFHYTTNGTTSAISGEGRDLVNFGSLSKGHSPVTGAVGARYRYSKHIEFGAAYEAPLFGSRDFFRYRVTADVIFRF